MKLLHHELIFAARSVDAESAPGDDFLSLAQVEAQPHRNTAPQNGPKLSVRILEREINVSGGGPRKVRHLPGGPDRRKAIFDQPLDLARQFADGQNLDAGGYEVGAHGVNSSAAERGDTNGKSEIEN